MNYCSEKPVGQVEGTRFPKAAACAESVLSILGGGDILLIVPPFVTSRTPILGPHILQSIARDLDYKTDILYVNLLLSSIMGVEPYESISYGQPFRLPGERLFARSAHGLPPLGRSPELCSDPAGSVFGKNRRYPFEEFEYKFYNMPEFDLDTFFEVETICTALVEEVCQAIASLDYKIVGCSSNWEQNNACIALINGIKKHRPDVVTLMGGSNCEAEMAEGIASLSQSIDYIFSGESESTFSDFLKMYSEGRLPSERIIPGLPVEDLDTIPLPEYESYFKQIDLFFAGNPPKGIVIGCETSRGCWWGKCSFCGMNGKRTRFRQKEVKKVVDEFERIDTRYPDHGILVIDKVMPPSYREELLPLLREKEWSPSIIYEQRPDLDLRDIIDLKKAGINAVKPGIEALSTGLLQLMNKGVTAGQNLLLLRNARSLGMSVSWNMLWGFPGDRAEFYRDTLDLLPLIRHFQPPEVFRHISIDRFCSYFEKPDDFGIEGLRPWAVYNMVYPDRAEVDKLAYRFIGDYPCEAHEHPELIREIGGRIETWKKVWKRSTLAMIEFAGNYLVNDGRGIHGENKSHVVDASRARGIMQYGPYTGSRDQEWAIELKLGAVVDSSYVPLITAPPGLLSKFEGIC